MRKILVIVLMICYSLVLCSCQELLDELNNLVPTTQPTDTNSNNIMTQVITPSPTPTLEDELKKLNEQDGDDLEIIEFKDIKVGDVIKFGKYEQDNNWDNGKEAIEWIVLSVEDDRALLFSKYVIACQRLVNIDTSDTFTWWTSTLREWLNESFYENAFDQIEQNTIQRTIVSTPDNPLIEYGGGGRDIIDKIFVLTVQDMCNPEYGFSPELDENDPKRCGEATKLMKTKIEEKFKDKKGKYVDYWLRSSGEKIYKGRRYNLSNSMYESTGTKVTSSGGFYAKAGYHQLIGIRPALYIKLVKPDDNTGEQ